MIKLHIPDSDNPSMVAHAQTVVYEAYETLSRTGQALDLVVNHCGMQDAELRGLCQKVLANVREVVRDLDDLDDNLRLTVLRGGASGVASAGLNVGALNDIIALATKLRDNAAGQVGA